MKRKPSKKRLSRNKWEFEFIHKPTEDEGVSEVIDMIMEQEDKQQPQSKGISFSKNDKQN